MLRVVLATTRRLEDLAARGTMPSYDEGRAALASEWSAKGPIGHAHERALRAAGDRVVARLTEIVATEVGAVHHRGEWAVDLGSSIVLVRPHRVVEHLWGAVTVQMIGTQRGGATRKAFTYLLDDIDDRLPFRRPSDLADPDLAAHFYRVSGGLIGLVLNYVRLAAYLAINEKADCITRAHLMRAAANRRTVDDRYQPFDGRLSLEETCVLPAEYGEDDGDEEPAPVPHLNKKRTRSGIL